VQESAKRLPKNWVVNDIRTGETKNFLTRKGAEAYAEGQGIPINELTVFNAKEEERKDARKNEKAAAVYGDVRNREESPELLSEPGRGEGIYAPVTAGEKERAQAQEAPGLEARYERQPFPYAGNKAWLTRNADFLSHIQEYGKGAKRIVDAFGGSGALSAIVQAQVQASRIVNEGFNPWLANFHKAVTEDRPGFMRRLANLDQEIRKVPRDKLAEWLIERVESGDPAAYAIAQYGAFSNAPLHPRPSRKTGVLSSTSALADLKAGINSDRYYKRVLEAPEKIFNKLDVIGNYEALNVDGWELARKAQAGDLVLLDPGYYTAKKSPRALGKWENQTPEKFVENLRSLRPAIERGARFVAHNFWNPQVAKELRKEGWTVEKHLRKQPGRKAPVEELIAYSPVQEAPGLETFLGEKARRPAEGLDKAKELQREGKSPEDVWKETGWLKGPDGKWRFEVDDSKMKIKSSMRELASNAQFGMPNTQKYLHELIQHDELFKQHPWLKNVLVVMDPTLGSEGSANAKNNWITLSPRMKGEELKRTLMHEIQHLVQAKEGFDKGYSFFQSQQDVFDSLPEGMQDDLREATRILKKKHEGEAVAADEVEWARQQLDQLDQLAYQRYLHNLGETEARKTEERLGLDASKRRETYPYPGTELKYTWINLEGLEGPAEAQAISTVPERQLDERQTLRTPEEVHQTLQDKLGYKAFGRLAQAGLVEVVDPDTFERRTGRDPTKVQGIARGGRIMIHSAADNPYAVLLHEGTHSSLEAQVPEEGLHLLLGDAWDGVQRQFDRMLKQGDSLAERAAKRAKDGREAMDKQFALTRKLLDEIEAQERLAYYTEMAAHEAPKSGLLKRIVGAIKARVLASPFGEQLSKLGIPVKLDPQTAVEMSKLALQRTFDLKAYYAELADRLAAKPLMPEVSDSYIVE
jgi:site-specific DNA-adenine methylase